MKVELSEALAAKLVERAKHLGVAPEALAQAAIADLLATGDGPSEASAGTPSASRAEALARSLGDINARYAKTLERLAK